MNTSKTIAAIVIALGGLSMIWLSTFPVYADVKDAALVSLAMGMLCLAGVCCLVASVMAALTR